MRTRAFIAVNLPDNIKEELTQWIDRAKKGLSSRNLNKLNSDSPQTSVCRLDQIDNEQRRPSPFSKRDCLDGDRVREKGAPIWNGNIKWVNPENFHFTLHFLGYLDDNKLQAVKKILNSSTKGEGTINLEISSFGCFPNESRPRVLFVDSHELNGNRLKDLQANIGKKLETIGIKTDIRSWKMHITFARLKKPAPLPLAQFKEFKKFKPLQFSINSIDLMKSELRRTGAKYSIIQTFQL